MSRITDWIDQTFYPTYGPRWDNYILRERICPKITAESRILDLGAGRGAHPELRFKGECAAVVGVDPDDIVLTNLYLDMAYVLEPPEYRIPFPDNHFDVVFCNSVLEHVVDESIFFQEVHRVLEPGGCFFAKTPNKNHYVALFARLTPLRFHSFYNHLCGRDEQDTFPTVYACNRKRDLVRALELAGMETTSLEIIEGRPEYLRLTAFSYFLGLLYERIVNATTFFEWARCVIIVQARKPKNHLESGKSSSATVLSGQS